MPRILKFASRRHPQFINEWQDKFLFERYWSDETNHYNESKSIQCTIGSFDITGQYFCEDDNIHLLTVTSEPYVNKQVDELARLLNSGLLFEQDVVLRKVFDRRLISKFGNLSWRLRLPDTFFMTRYLRVGVFTTHPENVQELKVRIAEQVWRIDQMLFHCYELFLVQPWKVHWSWWWSRYNLSKIDKCKW